MKRPSVTVPAPRMPAPAPSAAAPVATVVPVSPVASAAPAASPREHEHRPGHYGKAQFLYARPAPRPQPAARRGPTARPPRPAPSARDDNDDEEFEAQFNGGPRRGDLRQPFATAGEAQGGRGDDGSGGDGEGRPRQQALAQRRGNSTRDRGGPPGGDTATPAALAARLLSCLAGLPRASAGTAAPLRRQLLTEALAALRGAASVPLTPAGGLASVRQALTAPGVAAPSTARAGSSGSGTAQDLALMLPLLVLNLQRPRTAGQTALAAARLQVMLRRA